MFPARRRIGIITGSDSDLKQCEPGLDYFLKHFELAEITGVDTSSQHRHPKNTRYILTEYCRLHLSGTKIDALIIGAGKAAHLPCCSESFLRNELGCKIPVIAVAFAGKTEKETTAAILSIEEVPGTKVIFQDETGIKFVGADGFYRACVYAATGPLLEVEIEKVVGPVRRSLNEALAMSRKLKAAALKT